MNRIRTSAAAVLLLAALTASSCGSGDSGTVPSETEPVPETGTVTEAVTAADPMPQRDFEGYTFTFLNGNTSYAHNVLIIEEETGDAIDDAMYQRNLKVEERYNIKLAEVITTAPQNDYTKFVSAGDDAYDLALLRMEWAMPAVLANQTLPWSEVPHLNLDADYWVQGSIDSMSLANNVYFAVSAFDITHFDSVRAFCFNKQLTEALELTSPYQLVKEGKWTLDAYREMSLAAAEDINGNGKWDTDDRYGTVGYSNVYCNTLMTGIGSILSIGKDENDMPFFDLDSDAHITKLLAASELLGEKKNGLIATANDVNIFRAGRALFFVELICSMAPLRDMENDFGIIPAPKYDEAQVDYINLGGSPFFMVVPTTASDLDRTGAVMEALAYDSLGVIDTAYYDVVLKGKTSRDNESEEMLDLIFSTLEYYHPLANSYLNSPLADNYIWNAKDDFASYFAKVRPSIEKEINDALDTYTANVQ